MKLAIMHPSVLAKGLDDLDELVRRGIAGLQVQPSVFVDERGAPRVAPDRAVEMLTAAGLVVAAWCAYHSLIGPPDAVAASLGAQKGVIELADRFRVAAGGRRPIVCTETGDPAEWPDRSPDSLWAQLAESVGTLAAHAAEHEVCLAIEPTRRHLVDGAFAARKLLDEVASPRVGICFDPANICGDRDHLGRAINLLSDAIVIAHAKDVVFGPDGRVVDYPPAGKGQLDYAKFIALCAEIEACGHIVLEYLGTPEQADEAIAFVQGLLPEA